MNNVYVLQTEIELGDEFTDEDILEEYPVFIELFFDIDKVKNRAEEYIRTVVSETKSIVGEIKWINNEGDLYTRTRFHSPQCGLIDVFASIVLKQINL